MPYSWVTPPDFANGETVTESRLDYLSNDLNYLYERVIVPKVLVKQTAGQTGIPTGADTALVWDAEDLDTSNMFDTTGSATVRQQLVIPENGVYMVGCKIAIDNNATGVSRLLYITKNSTSPTQTATIAYNANWPAIQPGGGVPIIATNAALLNAGDVLRALVYQDSGANRSTVLSFAGVPTFYAFKVPGT